MSRTTHGVHVSGGRYDQLEQRRARARRALLGVEVVYDLTPDDHHSYLAVEERR